MSDGLTCRDIGFRHDRAAKTDRPLFEAVNAHFPCGRVSWIDGVTGAGKSTLLHLLAGLKRPWQGEIQADGQPVSRWLAAHRDRWRRQLGIIFQHHHLLADLTVLENVMLPLIPRPLPLGRMRDRAHRILDRVDLAEHAGRPVAELSGGERQRAAAARALVGGPRFVLADEPFAHQDDAHARGLLALLRETATEGAAVIIAAHDAGRMCEASRDHHWQLADGRCEEGACPSTPC
jgi:ABC-type lipoprotein export system ATPase subunit